MSPPRSENANSDGSTPERETSGKPSPIKVPADKQENRALKDGYVEEDNEDIAYLNCSLMWPIGVTSALSFGFFILSFLSMEAQNHLLYERFALNQILFSYGRTFGFCNNTFPYESGMWPSFLRQVELKVLPNVFFRVAVCVPMAVRIFLAFTVRNSTRDAILVRSNGFLKLFNEATAYIVIVETMSLALFSIITIRFDYPKVYDLMFGTFIVTAGVHMFLRSILSFASGTVPPPAQPPPLPPPPSVTDPRFFQRHRDVEPCYALSLGEQAVALIRVLATILFAWTSGQVFQIHQAFIAETGCHGYVSRRDALVEYTAIGAYAMFWATFLIDIRDLRFVCYPRNCSGECEPLRPSNFRRPDGKYAHCRAYEYQQRCGGSTSGLEWIVD